MSTIADKLKTVAENQQKVYDKGYDMGRYDEWDLFWETYQVGGKRTRYGDDYGYGYFTDETFKPKYTLYASASSAQFRESTITNYEALKMVDFSKVGQWANYFRASKIPHLGVIDTRGTYNPASLDHTFYQAEIEVIDKIIIKDDGKTTFTNAFFQAPNLTSVTFEGIIGSSVNLGSCNKLSVDSMKSVISCLANYAGTDREFTYKVTFTSGCWTALEESGSAPNGGTWREYVDSLGWNT